MPQEQCGVQQEAHCRAKSLMCPLPLRSFMIRTGVAENKQLQGSKQLSAVLNPFVGLVVQRRPLDTGLMMPSIALPTSIRPQACSPQAHDMANSPNFLSCCSHENGTGGSTTGTPLHTRLLLSWNFVPAYERPRFWSPEDLRSHGSNQPVAFGGDDS